MEPHKYFNKENFIYVWYLRLKWYQQPAFIFYIFYLIFAFTLTTPYTIISWFLAFVIAPIVVIHLWSSKQLRIFGRIVFTLSTISLMPFFANPEPSISSFKEKEVLRKAEKEDFEIKAACRTYVKTRLRDPDSYQQISWSINKIDSDGGYEIYHQFRAKNGFGGYNSELWILTYRDNRVVSHRL